MDAISILIVAAVFGVLWLAIEGLDRI